ncbi:MAG: hypothetical protein ACLRWQ_05060 [Flavonifractor plautii]
MIYKRGIEELPFADRWLASPTAMMLIPHYGEKRDRCGYSGYAPGH